MCNMFYNAAAFNGDLSKWDVLSATDMHSMFYNAAAFNGDLSKWDVSSVEDMGSMFYYAISFNGDPSKWDVSSVTKMDLMFMSVKSFKREVCGDAWIHSKTSKNFRLVWINIAGSVRDHCNVLATI